MRLGAEGCKSEVASPYAATPALLDTICSVVSTACRSAVALQLPVLCCAPSPCRWFGSTLKVPLSVHKAPAVCRWQQAIHTPALTCPAPPQDKCAVSLGDASVEVQQGRPDVEALLRQAAKEAGPGSVVGVYAGGALGWLVLGAGRTCQLRSAAKLRS